MALQRCRRHVRHAITGQTSLGESRAAHPRQVVLHVRTRQLPVNRPGNPGPPKHHSSPNLGQKGIGSADVFPVKPAAGRRSGLADQVSETAFPHIALTGCQSPKSSARMSAVVCMVRTSTSTGSCRRRAQYRGAPSRSGICPRAATTNRLETPSAMTECGSPRGYGCA